MADGSINSTLREAESLRNAGRHVEAIGLLEPLAKSHAHVAGVLHALGIALAVAGRHRDAADILSHAAEIEPSSADVLNNYGAMLLVTGRPHEAISPLRRALELRDGYADAMRNLAAALYRVGDAAASAGDLASAVESLDQAIALKPDNARAIARLGSVRRQQGAVDSAITLLSRAREIDPTEVDTLNNLGEALLFAGRADEAVEPLQRAIELQPGHAQAHLNLGCVRLRQSKVDQAIAQFETSIALSPKSPRAHMNFGIALLQYGDFARGWEECEWRLQLPTHLVRGIYHKLPAWRGEPLAGRTIFVHAEQGFGDAFQFVRYVPLVAEHGQGRARVLIGCRPSLRRLFERLPGVDGVVETGQPIPTVDFQCPFLSFPFVFKTTLETIPAQVPYLFPPDDAIEAWRRRLESDDRRGALRVGLTWAGNPSNPRDRYRSATFADLAPLGEVQGVAFYRLQLEGQVNSNAGPRMIDHTAKLSDWTETAALMCNLDVIISVDTATAHLAGALAKPTWTLLSAGGEWRWLIDRADSPWYPTMRLFRQKQFGDWRGVMQEVVAALLHMRE